MKRMIRPLLFLLVFCMTAAMLPGVSPAASAAGNIISVGDQGDVRAALQSPNVQSGDIIQITGTGFVNDTNSDSAPWIIDKAVTIRGADSTAVLNLRAGGIVLGADVTFENISLSFTNPVRSAIMANGHALTLTNVVRDTSAKKLHLFCGAVTGLAGMPASGSYGQIRIQDCTGLGNIYAGSISSDGQPNSSGIPAAVTISSGGAGQVGTLYGCGARQAPVDSSQLINPNYEPDPPAPSSEQFPVTGAVTFDLYHTVTSRVNGAGGGQNAAVRYTGSQDANDTLTLENLSALTLVSGGVLTPTEDSSFGAGMALTVPAGTMLDLTKLTAPQAGSFTGGGTLVLGEQETLTIGGGVTGITQVAIGSVLNGASGTVPVENFPYIVAPQSADGDFQLICHGNNLNDRLELSGSGEWMVPERVEGDAKVSSLTPKDVSAGSGDTTAYIPLNPLYTGSGRLELEELSLTILVNGSPAQWKADDENGGHYYEAAELQLLVNNTDDGVGLQIYSNPFGNPITDGTYYIQIVVPGSYTATGADLSASCILTVGRMSGLVSIPVPQANTGLVWTGAVQTGVYGGKGYTLTGHMASDAGNYTATASLETGCQWTDGTTEAKTVSWSIAISAVPPAAPGGLAGVAPTSAGGADGKITGTTAEMEYSGSSDFSSAQNCGGGETAGLAAGTYYVRIKGNHNHVAGAAAQVVVPEYNTPYVTGISIETPAGKTSYQVGEALDVTGLTIRADCSDGSSRMVAVTANMVSGFDSSRAAASQTLTITYGGRTASYSIQITGPGEPDHEHSWDTAWSVSGTHHWRNCVRENCPIQQDSEKKDYAAHTAGGWVVDQEATAVQSGSRHRSCSVCGYEMVRETIPASGGSSSGSSDSSSSDSGTSTTTVKNPDGSTTSTTVNKAAGTVTQTTRRRDGSTVTVETKKSGVVTTTEKAADGSTVKTTANPDGSSQTQVQRTDGTAASASTDRYGATQAQVSLSKGAVGTAREEGRPVSLPLPAVSAGGIASTVEISLPNASGAVKVEIPVKNAGPGTVAVIVNPDGSETVVKKSFAAEDNMYLTLQGGATVKLMDNSKQFSDAAGWASGAIDFVSARGIFNGTGGGNFSPDGSMTRGMLAVVLHSLENNPAGIAGSPFTDVEAAWYTDAVSWAAGQGIISGYGNGKFGPDDRITREQFVMMLWRYAGSPAPADREASFADSDKASAYALEALRWAKENGIVTGNGGGQLMPQRPATRAQAAQMLMNFIQKFF